MMYGHKVHISLNVLQTNPSGAMNSQKKKKVNGCYYTGCLTAVFLHLISSYLYVLLDRKGTQKLLNFNLMSLNISI